MAAGVTATKEAKALTVAVPIMLGSLSSSGSRVERGDAVVVLRMASRSSSVAFVDDVEAKGD